MSSNFYDVVVAGLDLGPLVAGALLSRRGFRVLVVRTGHSENRYSCLGFQFARKPFGFFAANAPSVTRVFDELSAKQQWSQLMMDSDVAYQVVLPDARVTVYRDPFRTRREIMRETMVSPVDADAVWRELGRLHGDIDRFFTNEMVLPPETFFERREVARSQFQNPFYMRQGSRLDDMLATNDRLRQVLDAPVRYRVGDHSVSAFLRARVAGSGLFDTAAVNGGGESLVRLLCERIVSNGGDVHPQQQLDGIVVRRGRVHGIRIVGKEEMTGTRGVLTGLWPKEMGSLIDPGAWTRRFAALVEDGHPRQAYGMNVGVHSDVIPEGMADTLYMVNTAPVIDGPIRVERIPQSHEQRAAVNVSCLVTDGCEHAISTGEVRDRLLDALRRLCPFLDNYLKVIHSPYDGFGPICLADTDWAEDDEDMVAPEVPHVEEIDTWVVGVPASGTTLGVENLPYRTGIKGLVLAGDQVMSGLGTEGAFLAGWGAARVAGRIDPSRQKVTRTMGVKEI